MNSIRAMAAGVALTVALGAGCSPEVHQSSETLGTTPTTELYHPGEYVPIPHAPPPGEDFRQLLQENAPINLVDIRTPDAGHSSEPFPADATAFHKRDHRYLKQVLTDIASETSDRYHPDRITVTYAGTLTLKSCLDSNNGTQWQLIHNYAGGFLKKGYLNAIVVDRQSCHGKMGAQEWAGASAPGEIPVINQEGLSELGRTIAHEGVGHSANVDHAGKLTCSNPEGITGCSIDLTGDTTSVMGYYDGKFFSAPELATQGLLKPTEILTDPGPGEYTLGDTANHDAELAKLLVLHTERGKLDFSWQFDPTANDTERCTQVPDSYYGDPTQSSLTLTITRPDGTHTKYKCVDNTTRHDHSLQVRETHYNEGMVGFELVSRKNNNNFDFSGNPMNNGEIKPGATLYEDKAVKVTLKAINPNNTASVWVQSLK